MEILEIMNCELSIITPNAFNATVFHRLQDIEFRSLNNFEFNVSPTIYQEWFAIVFTDVHFRHVAQRSFSPLKRNVKNLFIEHMPDDVNFAELFANDRFLTLTHLAITGVGDYATRLLDSSCLPRMPHIKFVMMRRCGITFVHTNTFKYTGTTLRGVYLDFNKLTTISIDAFASIMDAPRKQPSLTFVSNPLDCTCEFYELRNFTIIGSKQEMWEIGECTEIRSQSSCTNMQTISKRKLFIVNPDIFVYGLPKVSVRVGSDGFLVVITKFTVAFRLLVINRADIRYRKNSKCPMSEWMRNSVKCVRLTGSESNISIAQFRPEAGSSLLTLGVILPMANRQMWPLHIQTYRYSFDVVEHFGGVTVYILMCITSIAGLLIGGLIVYCYGKCKTMTEDKLR